MVKFSASETTGIPLSFFGDYHQLCIANPLGGSESNRYERGVHYTPAPIVNYLVKTILDRSFSERSIDEAKNLRILDPSCGCGAFLIASLQYILRWLEKHASNAYPESIVQERLDVLGKMLYGIDIDERAVSWTNRLLFLAIREASIPDFEKLSHTPSLQMPDLKKNIINGSYFDLPSESPNAKFDIIIGGPPFVRLRELHRSQPQQLSLYRKRFRSARRGQFDLYMLFIEQGLKILVDGGLLGFSVSNSFIRTFGGHTIRRFISQQSRIIEIVEFEDKQVYPEAVTQIALLSLKKGCDLERSRHVFIKGVGHVSKKLGTLSSGRIDADRDFVVQNLSSYAFDWPNWHLHSPEDTAWLAAMNFVGCPLKNFLIKISQGHNTGADDVFLMREVGRTYKNVVYARSRIDGKRYRLEGEAVRQIIRGRHINSYETPRSQDICIFPYDLAGDVFSEEILKKSFPCIYNYLLLNQRRLSNLKSNYGVCWYASSSKKTNSNHQVPVIIGSKISSSAGLTILNDPHIICHNSALILVPKITMIDPYALLGILNSAIFWRFARLTTPYMGCNRQVLRLTNIKQFPIPWPMTNEQKMICNNISKIAQNAMNASIPNTTQQIDSLVNTLYQLEK